MVFKKLVIGAIIALCWYVPMATKAADQTGFGSCSDLLSKFRRQCTNGPLELTKGGVKQLFNCPCVGNDTYCSGTGFCKTNARYAIEIVSPSSGAVLVGDAEFQLESGSAIRGVKLYKNYSNGRLEPMGYTCKITGSFNQGSMVKAKWSCQVQTNCFDSGKQYLDKRGNINRIKNSADMRYKCLANGNYWLLACSGSYCSRAVEVEVSNDLSASVSQFCLNHDYQCGQLNGIWGKTSCGTCGSDQYCNGSFKCVADVAHCENKDCGWDGRANNPGPCGGTGLAGDHGDGKGGCQKDYQCDRNRSRCVFIGGCKTNADCPALPPECADKYTLKIDIPYCMTGTGRCEHGIKNQRINGQYVDMSLKSCKPGKCQVINNLAQCVDDDGCSCTNAAMPCCEGCKPGPDTKCGGGILATSELIIPEPPSCVATKNCDISDFPTGYYSDLFSVQYETGENVYANGRINRDVVESIDKGLAHHPALRYCDNLTLHGNSDWYLPSKTELMSLYNSYFEPLRTNDPRIIKGDNAYYTRSGLLWGTTLSSQSYYGDRLNLWKVDFIHYNLAPDGYMPKGLDKNTRGPEAQIVCVRKK